MCPLKVFRGHGQDQIVSTLHTLYGGKEELEITVQIIKGTKLAGVMNRTRIQEDKSPK